MEIFIKTRFAGLHRWADAPKEVDYLKAFHRHNFYVKVFFEVEHDDRDLEFFITKAKLDNYIDAVINKADCGSCEMIARLIADFDHRITKVEVSEDDDNGALYIRE